MLIEDNIFSVADDYDAFFVDIYGVLYSGFGLFDGTLETLQKLKKNLGKKIIILSNTTQVSAEARQSYEKLGMLANVHYDLFITSGELLRHELRSNFSAFSALFPSEVRTIASLFQWNSGIFQDNVLRKVESYDDADIIYVGAPKIANNRIDVNDLRNEDGGVLQLDDVVCVNWKTVTNAAGDHPLAELAELLEEFFKKNKVLLVANPDIFAQVILKDAGIRVPLITQGCIGRYYEKLGGHVVYLGKPYRRIFEFATACVSEKFKDGSSLKIAMVGDTPWTDILGANISGIDAIMTLTGVVDEFIAAMSPRLSEAEKMEEFFCKISTKMMEMDLCKLLQKNKFSDGELSSQEKSRSDVDGDCQDMAKMVYPKHVIRRFASTFD
jgi:HAD superfamily hydrolase (TIGR01450 family)